MKRNVKDRICIYFFQFMNFRMKPICGECILWRTEVTKDSRGVLNLKLKEGNDIMAKRSYKKMRSESKW